MKQLIFSLLITLSVSASAATVVLDNKDHSAVVTAGSNANFTRQSFTLNVAGGTAGNASSNDNVTASLPLPAFVALQTIAFVESPSDNGTSTSGSLYLKIFSDAGATGAPVAVSTNSIDVRAAINGGALSDLTWTFASDSLSSSTEYHIRWATNALADNTGLGIARIAAANFGGGFVSTYSGGTASNTSAVAFDSRFEITFDTVPEPGSAMLILTTGAFFLRRRRA